MGKINFGRVFLGGIAAGGFSLAVQYLAIFIGFSRQMREVTGVAHYSAADQLTVAAVELFVGGPLAIWLYAAIRPRFGAGPRTAVIAALWLWIVLGPYLQTVITTMGFVKPLPLSFLIAMDAMALPEIVIAVLIGAWLYKEESAAGQAPAR
jgi:hypothetical protein